MRTTGFDAPSTLKSTRSTGGCRHLPGQASEKMAASRSSAKGRILEALARAQGPVCDDCLVEPASLSARQVAYQVCTAMASEGEVTRARQPCTSCYKRKYATLLEAQGPVLRAKPVELPDTQDGGRPWYWEGNVQAVVVEWLRSDGYRILAVSDTASKAQGIDIIADCPREKELWVEVKGWPEKSPNTQGRHWFAGVHLEVMLRKGDDPNVNLAIALPDGFPTYLNLARRVSWFRKQAGLSYFWVAEDRTVRIE